MDTDIKVALQAIAEQASKEGKVINIITSPEVQGAVSIDLQNVDWETALKVLLKTYNFGLYQYKNVIMVASPEKIAELEKQATETAQLKVFRLKYIDAGDAKKAAEPLLSKNGKIAVLETTGQSGWGFGQSTMEKAEYNKSERLIRTKVLVVSDVAEKIDQVSTLLAELDVMPKQILIKTRIMEVNRNLLRDIGFNWGTGASGVDSSTLQTIPLAKTSGRDVAQVAAHSLASTPSAFDPESTGLTSANSGLSLMFRRVAGAQFETLLRALDEDTRANTLSAPVILTLNNQEATILIGTQYPIIKTDVSTQTNYIVGGSLQEYKDIGIQLNVVPQIWGEKEDFVNMIVHPAVSSYTTTAKVISQSGTTLVEYPIISTREAETQLVLKDGETIVMGGLLKDVITKQDIGIPFLRKIPFLGKLFNRETHDSEKIDLMIFISAHILEAGEDVPQEVLGTQTLESKFAPQS